MAPALNVDTPACFLQFAFAFGAGVAPISIDIMAGVSRIEQGLEDSCVGYGGIGDGELAISL
jgi:hypothetical protein